MNIYEKLFEVKKVWIKLERDTEWYWYKYATLSQIQEKLWPVLEKQKLLIVHTILDKSVRTQIIDLEAKENEPQSMISEIPLSQWVKAQDLWSEITYFRRYNLLALLDLEVEDDDWATASNKKPIKAKTEPTERFNAENLVKFAQIKELHTKENAVKFCRTKYKVSKDFAEQIEDLYINQ